MCDDLETALAKLVDIYGPHEVTNMLEITVMEQCGYQSLIRVINEVHRPEIRDD